MLKKQNWSLSNIGLGQLDIENLLAKANMKYKASQQPKWQNSQSQMWPIEQLYIELGGGPTSEDSFFGCQGRPGTMSYFSLNFLASQIPIQPNFASFLRSLHIHTKLGKDIKLS